MTVVIAERNNLTDCAYKSIISVLEVMFNSEKVTKYFKENYIAEGLNIN